MKDGMTQKQQLNKQKGIVSKMKMRVWLLIKHNQSQPEQILG